jgi:hypothetical protein
LSKPETSTSEILVHLVRPGVATRDYHLSEGATLADLVRLSGVSTTDQAVLVEGVPIEEALPLLDGAVVTIAPQSRNVVGIEPWRAAITAFQDDALFQEYRDILETRRHEMIPEEDPGA